MRVLDAGCGNGLYLRGLRDRRVVAAGGACIAVTNGARPTRSLRDLVERAVRGETPGWRMRPATHAFTAENAAAQLAVAFETACVQLHGKLKPFREKDGTFRTGKPWHCIDGGPGSYFTDGYDDGARTFANAIITAAQAQGWTTQLQVETRPVNPGSIDENGVGASGQVYVVTVSDNAPQD